jgi:hypothetical protein
MVSNFYLQGKLKQLTTEFYGTKVRDFLFLFFELSYDFKMNRFFLNLKKSSSKSQIYEKFLNQSLKKFIEYQR